MLDCFRARVFLVQSDPCTFVRHDFNNLTIPPQQHLHHNLLPIPTPIQIKHSTATPKTLLFTPQPVIHTFTKRKQANHNEKTMDSTPANSSSLATSQNTPPTLADEGRSADERNHEETLSPLEQDVLDEYARLLGNMNDVSFFVRELCEIGKRHGEVLWGLCIWSWSFDRVLSAKMRNSQYYKRPFQLPLLLFLLRPSEQNKPRPLKKPSLTSPS